MNIFLPPRGFSLEKILGENINQKAVLTAAGKELDEKEIHRKEKHNIQIWCKANDIEPQFPWRDEDEEVLNFEPEIE